MFFIIAYFANLNTAITTNFDACVKITSGDFLYNKKSVVLLTEMYLKSE